MFELQELLIGSALAIGGNLLISVSLNLQVRIVTGNFIFYFQIKKVKFFLIFGKICPCNPMDAKIKN